jgi:TatA/E family protein of Tat protein translocase
VLSSGTNLISTEPGWGAEVDVFDSIDDWLIIAVVAGILFYGSSKIPQLAHSLGRSVGEFKKGRLEVDREIRAEQAAHANDPAPAAPPR